MNGSPASCWWSRSATGTGFRAAPSVPIWDWVPTSPPPGDIRVQGGLTRTGNSHARLLLTEAAGITACRIGPSYELRRRWDAASPAARARGHAGNRRLHQRWRSFAERKKRPMVANAAIGRQLAGWCWSLAVLDD